MALASGQGKEIGMLPAPLGHNKIDFEGCVEVKQLAQLLLPSGALRAKLEEVRIFEGRKSLTWTMTLLSQNLFGITFHRGR